MADVWEASKGDAGFMSTVSANLTKWLAAFIVAGNRGDPKGIDYTLEMAAKALVEGARELQPTAKGILAFEAAERNLPGLPGSRKQH